MDNTRQAIRTMASEDPELAARLVLQGLPAAAGSIDGPLAYELNVEGLGSWLVWSRNGQSGVEEGGAGDRPVDFRLTTDPATLAEMAGGESAVKLMLGGRVRIRGKRRKALKLRSMGDAGAGLDEVARAGGRVDPDLLYRALPYLVPAEWTKGHSFKILQEIGGEGAWLIDVRDGERIAVTPGASMNGNEGISHVKLSGDTFRRLLARELTPPEAMQQQLTTIDGPVAPVTLLGRWMERAQGNDDAELAREAEQREIQARRAGSWGATMNGDGSRGGQGDPGHAAEGERRKGGDLMSYHQLYALWEKQNWKAHELDFSVDKEQWLITPREAQLDTQWSLGAFYVGEERVAADLAPFVLAAPSGEIEAFLSTQLVDEVRHAVFFDRFGAEVMCLGADDLRSRLAEIEATMLRPWHDVFDDGLREIAHRIAARPDDLPLFVEGITTYHMIIEGVLAMTGQRLILKYMGEHDIYPGFQKGFGLVEQDEHRHIAFGVKFLKDAVEEDPALGKIVQGRIEELVPKAMKIFVPPYAESAREFTSYSNTSGEIYGYAYRALKRRMNVIGLEIPGPEDLMPGPIDDVAEAPALA
ncbi:MAG: SCP2 sterol-binding domain-containing protein [Thermoleophilaceae bacterium]|nr:SCP2 sterol-binding domain-containing protein [Thermoleophilaceae bacterium]